MCDKKPVQRKTANPYLLGRKTLTHKKELFDLKKKRNFGTHNSWK